MKSTSDSKFLITTCLKCSSPHINRNEYIPKGSMYVIVTISCYSCGKVSIRFRSIDDEESNITA
jgi:hypothetical protein